ncbi:MAG: hypothetical protein SFV81_23670, partial [Pirellulaceae bacterium]|nr:hypothetical protein [Pirellulaceae bacterium]
MTIFVFVSTTFSGCLTNCVCPLGMSTKNGSKGRAFKNSRMFEPYQPEGAGFVVGGLGRSQPDAGAGVRVTEAA